MKRAELIELPGHVGLIALGQPWFNDRHLADLATACYIAIDIADKDSDVFQMAMNGLHMLHDQCDDYVRMKHEIGTVVQWVSVQPNKKVYDSVVKRLKEIYGPQSIS